MLELFEVRVPVAELVVRGSAIFWFLFLIFRFVLRRDVGALGVADILLLVIVADASQNAMAGEYTTISEGFILVGTIVGWNWLLDYLAFKSKYMRRFVNPSRLLLISAGKPQLHNMKRQFITLEDLQSMLRQPGHRDHGRREKGLSRGGRRSQHHQVLDAGADDSDNRTGKSKKRAADRVTVSHSAPDTAGCTGSAAPSTPPARSSRRSARAPQNRLACICARSPCGSFHRPRSGC